MKSIYTSGQYTERNPSYHVEDSPWKVEQVLRLLRRHSLPLKRVCEVGCGAGEVLRQLQQHLPDAVAFDGFDISPQAYALSRERANPRLRFFCEDFLLANRPVYDLLLVMDVIEHVDDYIGFLKNLRGRATHKILHIPLDLSAQTVFRGRPIARARASYGHIHYFTKDTALATLSYTQYEILDWMYTGSGTEKSFGFLNLLARYPRLFLSQICPDFCARVLGGYSLLVLCR